MSDAPPTISAAQYRAGRALIEMDQAKLARRSVASTDTIVDFENRSRMPIESSLAAIRAALEFRCVIFIDGDEPAVNCCRRVGVGLSRLSFPTTRSPPSWSPGTSLNSQSRGLADDPLDEGVVHFYL
jgi:hypothetical protein